MRKMCATFLLMYVFIPDALIIEMFENVLDMINHDLW